MFSKNKIYKDAPQIYLYNNGLKASRKIGDVTRAHWGIDYNANCAEGDKLIAPFSALLSGIVVDVVFSKGPGGNYVVIEATKAKLGDFKHIYIRSMHHSEIMVVKGSVVQQGDIIALQGNTGAGSTGPHVHLETYASYIPYEKFSSWKSSNPQKFHFDPRSFIDIQHNMFVDKFNDSSHDEQQSIIKSFGTLSEFKAIFNDQNMSYCGNLFYNTKRAPVKYNHMTSKLEVIEEDPIVKIYPLLRGDHEVN